MFRRAGVLVLALAAPAFTVSARAGTITGESYAAAYSQGLAVIFPPSVYPLGTPTGADTAFYFSGMESFVNSTLPAATYEACAPSAPVGNGIHGGCPTTRPGATTVYTDGANSVSHTTSVNSAGNTQSYTGTTTSTVAGMNESGSFSASVASPAAGQFGYINDYASGDENFIVAPTIADPAGTTGSLVLTYTISPPDVTGSATGGNAVWYGEWAYQSWFSAGDASADDYQFGTVDLSTITGPTQIQFTAPFLFGTATNVKTGDDVGMGWSATGGGPLTASGDFDPLESLTGVEVLGPDGAPLSNFTITDSNGAVFGPDGVVPEPSTFGLLGLGLLSLAGVRRFKRA